MRSRNLKPSLFKNELLATADPLHTVIFTGLWCMADRAGRLEDRPAKIHFEINPGRALSSTEESLKWLSDNGFIERYGTDGAKYIQVSNFSKHQTPHIKEGASTIPAPYKNGADTSAAHLIPSSLIPDSPSLIPDSVRGADAPDDVPPKTKSDRGSRIPEPFEVTDAMRKWFAAKCPHVILEDATDEFVRYWKAVPGAKGRKLDWEATWQNRMVEVEARAALRHKPPKSVADRLTWRPE